MYRTVQTQKTSATRNFAEVFYTYVIQLLQH